MWKVLSAAFHLLSAVILTQVEALALAHFLWPIYGEDVLANPLSKAGKIKAQARAEAVHGGCVRMCATLYVQYLPMSVLVSC